MPLGRPRLHEATITPKKDRPANRLGGNQRCAILSACLGCLLPDAASLLRVLLCKFSLDIRLQRPS
jgi:hypothetical protein